MRHQRLHLHLHLNVSVQARYFVRCSTLSLRDGANPSITGLRTFTLYGFLNPRHVHFAHRPANLRLIKTLKYIDWINRICGDDEGRSLWCHVETCAKDAVQVEEERRAMRTQRMWKLCWAICVGAHPAIVHRCEILSYTYR